MLGMTYGNESQVSSQIKGNLDSFDDKALIGDDFWSFLTGQEDYFSQLISIITGLSDEYEERHDNDYLELVENKKSELIGEWKRQHGADGHRPLEDFVSEYTAK